MGRHAVGARCFGGGPVPPAGPAKVVARPEDNNCPRGGSNNELQLSADKASQTSNHYTTETPYPTHFSRSCNPVIAGHTLRASLALSRLHFAMSPQTQRPCRSVAVCVYIYYIECSREFTIDAWA
ncbi:hypothetical protein MTO96_014431 [Rhipicephalus appendiculatus]